MLRALALAVALAVLGCQTGTEAPPKPPAVLSVDGVTANFDSAVVSVPVVAGAKDYRAWAVSPDVQVTTAGGREHVKGATIFCAGWKQGNTKAAPAPEPLQQIEIAGLTGPTDIVVEAIDRPCPFTGAMGSSHVSIPVSTSIDATMNANVEMFTEAELRAKYDSLIVNGHGAGTLVGGQANPDDPVVLATSTVHVTPLGNAIPRTATFFDDFSKPDQPVYVQRVDDGSRTFQQGRMFQNTKWSFYAYGNEPTGVQMFVDRGELHMLLADWAQDVFGSLVAVPRKVAHLPPDGKYLRITFEVPSDSTGRRYWWLSVCGAATAGATLNADGSLAGHIVQTPFFSQSDGLNPMLEGWNCFQIFPRDGSPYGLAPTGNDPQSDIRVIVNVAMPPPDQRNSVRNLSPNQYGNVNVSAPSWYRQMKSGALSDVILDDQLFIGQRTRFDLYLSRSRAILFANDGQRLCNDFPSYALTMAEAFVGFGQVLYHSAAERSEFSVSYWDRTAQLYYLQNTPFIDHRNWDNLGFDEAVPAPAGFQAGDCYVAP